MPARRFFGAEYIADGLWRTQKWRLEVERDREGWCPIIVEAFLGWIEKGGRLLNEGVQRIEFGNADGGVDEAFLRTFYPEPGRVGEGGNTEVLGVINRN